jgi:heme-degrading monooxygenase HmoA
MFDRFSEPARRALFYARYEVTQLGGTTIEPEHLVLGVLQDVSVLGQFARDPGAVGRLRAQLETACRGSGSVSTSVEMPFSDAAKAALERAAIEADDLGNRWIRPEHILLGVIVKTSGAATRALHEAGVAALAIRDFLRSAPDVPGERTGAFSPPKIARQWKGVTRPGQAEAYIGHLQQETLPALERLPGFAYAMICRREVDGGTEFQVTTCWSSLDAIRAFAGDDVESAVVPPAAQALLASYDRRVVHYDLVNP